VIDMKTLILGGGLSGLVLGNFLKDKGREDFVILEKNHECGGLCRSVTCEGFTFDYGGSHIIFSRDEKVLKFMVDGLGKNVVRNRRNTKIFFKGRYVKYPFENGLSELPKQDTFECLYYFVQTLCDPGKKDAGNFRKWIYDTFGKGIADAYMIPYNEKIWNFKCENMCTEWIEGRVPKPPVEDIIRSAVGIETEGYKHQLHFYYPKKGGIQAMIRAFEKPLRDKIILDFGVKSIMKDDEGFVVSDGEKKVKGDRVVSTLPMPEIVDMIDGVPEDVKCAASNLKFNSLVTVMVGVDVSKINDLSWLYVPSKKDGLFNRVSFPSNYSVNVAPHGKSSVLAEITCNFGDNVWRMKDDEIGSLVVSDLSKMGIVDESKVCFSLVKRAKYAYVIYDMDYPKNVKIVRDWLEGYGIEAVGRFSEFKYLNMDACIKSVMEFVNSKMFSS